MTTTVLTPVDRGNARQSGASRLWRKQILPVGTIDYKGRKIPFTKEYLAGLVEAFTAHAFDQVAFQLAPGDNSHTNDPERFRGEIRGFEATDDGLDLILAATEDGDRVLRENPSLGVSARIVEDYQRADGKFFPAAIQHVLGTLDPRITGMRPWQAVEAANEPGEVIDLTGAEYEAPADAPTQPVQPAPADPGASTTEDTHMALSADQEARLSKLLDLPAEQFDALLLPPEKPAEGDTEGDLTDAQLEELVASIEAEDTKPEAETAPEKEPVPAGASLTAEAQTAIDLANTQIGLANARAEENALALKRVTTKLATAEYEKERDFTARTFGIPPRIFDLARPLLEGDGKVVDLANGKKADAGAICREVFKEIGRTVKMLDLSGELGSAVDGAADAAREAEDSKTAAREALVSEMLSSGKYGL